MTLRRAPLVIGAAAVSVVSVVACVPAAGGGDSDADDVAACDAPRGGIALDEGLVEEEAGYDDALAALDIDALDADVSLAGVEGFFRDVIAWALDVRDLGDSLDRDALRETMMGRAVLGSFATENADPLDERFLRRGLHRFYACSRDLPPTLDAFAADSGVAGADLAVRVLDDSRPKAPLRRRLSEAADHGVYMAETLNDDDSVRETEIVWSGRRNDGLLDFLVYDEHGVLSAASHFASDIGTATTAAPYTCLLCHASDDGFDVVSPPR